MKPPRFRVWLGYAALAGVAAFLMYICVATPARLTVRSADLPLDSWPEKLNGFSVAVLTDLHFFRGETGRMRKIHRAVRELDPDMIVILGDIFCACHQPAETVGEEELRFFFRGFSAPAGIYAVYGNHEIFFDKKRIAEIAADSGVRFLRNESLTVSTEKGAFLLSGIDDLSTSYTSLPEKTEHAAMPEILLSHDPLATLAFRDRQVDLILSGHLHGGQLCWPSGETVYPFTLVTTWFPVGLSEAAGRKVFLGNGLGSGRLIPRWNCPPEIVFLRFYSSGSVPAPPVARPEIHPKEQKDFNL